MLRHWAIDVRSPTRGEQVKSALVRAQRSPQRTPEAVSKLRARGRPDREWQSHCVGIQEARAPVLCRARCEGGGSSPQSNQETCRVVKTGQGSARNERPEPQHPPRLGGGLSLPWTDCSSSRAPGSWRHPWTGTAQECRESVTLQHSTPHQTCHDKARERFSNDPLGPRTRATFQDKA